MKYFKRKFATVDHEWTVYGAYEESDVTQEGDVLVSVYSVDCYGVTYSHSRYEDYFELDKLIMITEEEYNLVLERLLLVGEVQGLIDDMLKKLL